MNRWLVRGVAPFLLALLLAPPARAEERVVPSIAGLELGAAREKLEAAGFRVGTVYELARARVLQSYGLRVPYGFVFMQQPRPGVRWSTERPVSVIVSAPRDGEIPAGLPGLEPARRPAPPPPPPPAAVPRGAERPVAPPPPPVGGPAARPLPAPAPPGDEDAEDAALGGDPLGSPDAPRRAPRPDPAVVPTLTGLELVEAEQLVRDAKMTLYVERVPGHPVGRVLEQDPMARSARPRGGVVKIVVTAGGDFAAAVPSAPEVYVPDVSVPGLLDRTALQAERIIGDLGLVLQQEMARRGLAGRVVDQMPMAGGRVPKGAVVRVWIGPPDPEAAEPDPSPAPPDRGPDPAPPTPPLESGSPPGPDPRAANPRDEPEEPGERDPNAPLPPGPLPGGAPEPIAPRYGAVIPRGESVPIGFSWRPVKRAAHYVLEVEEEGAGGRWLPSVRKPARKTAAIVEIDRLSTVAGAKLRWRVRAVLDGREGAPSRWVVLK